MNLQEHEALSARVLEEYDLMRTREESEFRGWFRALSCMEMGALLGAVLRRTLMFGRVMA